MITYARIFTNNVKCWHTNTHDSVLGIQIIIGIELTLDLHLSDSIPAYQRSSAPPYQGSTKPEHHLMGLVITWFLFHFMATILQLISK